MNRRLTRTLACASLLLATLCLGCGGPLGPIAGGELRGTVVADPVVDWQFTEPVKTIAVETRPEDPHSVTTWCVAVDGHLYVPSLDPGEKDWVAYVRADDRIRIRIEGKIYAGTATELQDAEEIAGVAARLIQKYELEPPSDAEERPDMAYFRIESR